jgi:hypothetical protein
MDSADTTEPDETDKMLCASETAPGFTVTEVEVTLSAPLVAVKVLLPDPVKVMEKPPVPLDRFAGAGGDAPSLNTKLVEEEWEVAVFPKASNAVTPAVNAPPAVTLAGTPESTSWVADPELTVSVAVADASPVAAAVMVRDPAVLSEKEGAL